MKTKNLTTTISERNIESHSNLLQHSEPIIVLSLIFKHNQLVILTFINQLIPKFNFIIQPDLLQTLSLNPDQHEDIIDRQQRNSNTDQVYQSFMNIKILTLYTLLFRGQPACIRIFPEANQHIDLQILI